MRIVSGKFPNQYHMRKKGGAYWFNFISRCYHVQKTRSQQQQLSIRESCFNSLFFWVKANILDYMLEGVIAKNITLLYRF